MAQPGGLTLGFALYLDCQFSAAITCGRPSFCITSPVLCISVLYVVSYWTLLTMVGVGGSQVRSDGVLEAQLYLHHVMPYHFRKYTLVAENSVAMTTRQVQLLRAPPEHTVATSK